MPIVATATAAIKDEGGEELGNGGNGDTDDYEMSESHSEHGGPDLPEDLSELTKLQVTDLGSGSKSKLEGEE